MANFFDQFDATPPPAPPVQQPLPALFDENGPDPYAKPPASANFFDQFDDASARPLTVHPRSTAADVAMGVGTGLVKGAAAIPGMVGDISDLANKAPSYAGLYLADKLGMLPQGETFDSALKFANSPAMQAPPSPGVISAMSRLAPPTTGQVLDAGQAAYGKLPVPQTGAGQAAENIAGFVPASLAGPGGLARKAIAYGVVPGAISEGAGEAGSLISPSTGQAARIAGGVLGAGVGHLGGGPTPIDTLISGATRGITDAHITQASQLMANAEQQGIRLTPAEALQHVTNGRSALGNLQRHVEGMNESAPTMADFMANRPQQVRQATMRTLDTIAPRPDDPFQTGVAAQREAEGAMRNIRQDRTNATSRYYQAAEHDEVPQDRMRAVADHLDALAAESPNNPDLTAPLADLRRQIVATPARPAVPATPPTRVPVNDPRTGALIRYDTVPGTPAIPAQPETYIANVGQLDKIYGALRDQYTGPAPLGQSGTQARAGRIAGQGLDALNTELRDSSPALAAGRTAHGIMTERWVAPREAAPIGQISQTNDLGQQAGAIFPSNPLPGSHYASREAIERLPQTGPTIVRSHLERAFNEGSQNNMGGPNQFGGAKFAAQVAGNRQQEANLLGGLDALPNAGTASPSTQMLLESLRATGQRMPIGSRTAYNEHLNQAMEAGSPLGSAASLAASPEKALSFIRDLYQQRRIGANAEGLADMLTSGQGGLDRISQARALSPPGQYRSLLAQMLLARMAASGGAGYQTGERQ